jgi:hypothetical protein
MARDDAPPFARGETFYNGGLIDPSDPLGLGGLNYEGKEFVFEVNAQDQGTGYPAGQDPTGRPIRVRVVRNVSGGALKGGRIAHYKAEDPYECHVDGYCFALGDRPAGVIDEFLPPAGVPNNDLFYVVIDGPTLVQNTHTSPTTFAIGDKIVPTAGGASSVTDDLGGRVAKQDLTGATATLGNNIQHAIGYAAAADNTIDDKFAAIVHRAFR